jgi:diguanylate cyclase (GGDEF)-like protein
MRTIRQAYLVRTSRRDDGPVASTIRRREEFAVGVAANAVIDGAIGSDIGPPITAVGPAIGTGIGSATDLSREREARQLTGARRAVVTDRTIWAATGAGVLWLLAYVGATVATTRDPDGRLFLDDVVYLVPVALATVLSALVARRATSRRRHLWGLLVVSNVLWLGGDVVGTGYDYLLRREAPVPSVADLLYLASYAVVPAAVFVGFGAGSTGRRRLRSLLDAVVVGLGLGAAGWYLLIAPQLASAPSPAKITSMAYPLLGVVIVITLASVALAGHRLVAPSVWMLALAFTVSALTDAAHTYLKLVNGLGGDDWFSLGWQAEAVLLCLAAVCALRHDEGEAQLAPLGRDLAMIPVLLGVLAALLLAAADALRRGVNPVLLATAAVVVAGLVVRFVLSVADARRAAVQLDAALREQKRLAVTDGLTGLYNRRFFEEVLRLETERALRGGRRLALLVTDLDRFKNVNDAHGHQSGDAVLVEAADRLRRTLRASDVLARYGGEEFVTVLPDADRDTALEIAERCRIALSREPVRLQSGQHVTVTGSFGLALLAVEPDASGPRDAAALLRRADRALYAAKGAGRNRVQMARAEDEALDDVDPALEARAAALVPLELLADVVDARIGRPGRSAAMARWAGVLADALRLEPGRRRLVVEAARLHDIGMIVLTDVLLSTPGPLAPGGWRLMRTHPQEGGRLVLGVPGHEALAAIVRGHHERWDGRGYPDGVPGRHLPIETRIIGVLDAWAAMVGERPYRSPIPVARARGELLAARWAQLDGDVVDAFLKLQAAGLVGDLDTATWPPAGEEVSVPSGAIPSSSP